MCDYFFFNLMMENKFLSCKLRIVKFIFDVKFELTVNFKLLLSYTYIN